MHARARAHGRIISLKSVRYWTLFIVKFKRRIGRGPLPVVARINRVRFFDHVTQHRNVHPARRSLVARKSIGNVEFREEPDGRSTPSPPEAVDVSMMRADRRPEQLLISASKWKRDNPHPRASSGNPLVYVAPESRRDGQTIASN